MALTTKILIASLLMAAPASAADIILAEPAAPVAIETVLSFTGFTAGAFLGGAYSDGETRLGGRSGALIDLDVRNGLFPQSIDDSDTGFLGGVSVGYNRQFGDIVAGIEADLSFLDLETHAGLNRRDPNPDPVFFNVQTITSYKTEIDTLGTVRGRLGVVVDRTLLYSTGGLAIADVENGFTLSIPELGYASPGWSESGTRYGYVVGGGIEQKLTQSVGIRAEGLYYDLDNTTVYAADPATFPGQRISYGFDNDGFIARVGVVLTF